MRTSSEILAILTELLPGLSEEYGVTALALFGSVARGDAVEGSDVDLLVEFGRPVGLFKFLRLRQEVEDCLGLPVDLVEPGALPPEVRRRVLSEAKRAA